VYPLIVRKIPGVPLVMGMLILLYVVVWFTDSIWEYIPESNPRLPMQATPNPIPSSSPECQTYWNNSGEAESSCEPVDLEDPGWQGR